MLGVGCFRIRLFTRSERTQTKRLEPQEHAKLHNALTVGRTDLTHSGTATDPTSCHSSCRTSGVGVAEVRRIEKVLRFGTNLQVEALGELEDSSQAGVKLPQAWTPEPRFRPAHVAYTRRGEVRNKG